jgi:hypothetical protein
VNETSLLDLEPSIIALLPVHDAELLECISQKIADEVDALVVCRIHPDEAAEFFKITGFTTPEFQIKLHDCCSIESNVVGYAATSESLDSWCAAANTPHPVTQIPTPAIIRHEFRFSGGTCLIALTDRASLEPWKRSE